MSDISLPPEILRQIVTIFEDDYKTLYSCLLVNRYWCCNVVPILWRKMPDNFPRIATSSWAYKFIQAYINCLSTDTRAQLGLTESDQQKESSVLLYPTYLKVLDFQRLSDAIVSWCIKLNRNIYDKKTRRGSHYGESEKKLKFLEVIVKLLHTSKARIQKVIFVLSKPINVVEKQPFLRIVTNLVEQSQTEDSLLGKLREVHFSQYVFMIQEVFKLFARHCNNFQCLKLKNIVLNKRARRPIEGLLQLIQAAAPNLKEITCDQFGRHFMNNNLEIWPHISSQLSVSLRKITIIPAWLSNVDYLDFLLQFKNLETLEIIGAHERRYITSAYESKRFPSLKNFIHRNSSKDIYSNIDLYFIILSLSQNTLQSLILDSIVFAHNQRFLNHLQSLVTLTELTIKIDEEVHCLQNFLQSLEQLHTLKFLRINGIERNDPPVKFNTPRLFPAVLTQFELSTRFVFTVDSFTAFLGYFEKLPRLIMFTVYPPTEKRLLDVMKNLALGRGETIHGFGCSHIDNGWKLIWISLD
ncbi:11220_t:CDS:2 [Ambispora leptoticha]|uniref:11220_t:CDS:1 n=1 Tax=Ambispora leptoticha TaxID=144679 RepID=A0A9N9BJ01_9GLOM|nr:11220_t:CDS:2 [Ambispora leptoticha]